MNQVQSNLLPDRLVILSVCFIYSIAHTHCSVLVIIPVKATFRASNEHDMVLIFFLLYGVIVSCIVMIMSVL